MKRILCIWLPRWPIQRLLVARPELKRRAVVLHDAATAGGPRVKFCSSTARARGVCEGLPLAEALALWDPAEKTAEAGTESRARKAEETAAAEPGPHVEAHDPRTDWQALRQLASWCQRFSPLVGWQVAEGEAESLLLDVTGLEALFGGERALAGEVVERFGELGYTVRVAIADTVGAAWAVAHFGDPAASSWSDSAGATGSAAVAAAWVVPREAGREALAGLPVEALRLEAAQSRTLRQLGVERIEQLWELERESLAARLGEGLLRRLDQALGAVEELIAVPRAAPRFHAQWRTEHPLEGRSLVEEVLQQLVRRVATSLAARDAGVVQLQCLLDCGGGQPLELRIGLFRPTAEPEHLLELLRLRLERLVLPGPVRAIDVDAVLTAPREHQQQRLFGRQPGEEQEGQVARLIDRLRSRLGSQGVLRPVLQADAQPEWAWVPSSGAPGSGRQVSGAGRRGSRMRRSAAQGGPRPLRLFCPALPLQVVAVVPDGPPVRIRWRQWLSIAECWGPERIETGWWRGRSVRRDYYRIQTSEGSCLWIYRQLPDGPWFLHGEFM